jgi:(p)ppGpp synthase/HD superfamily hydrolase
VKHWFREQGRESAISAGREQVTKELERVNLEHVSLEEIATALKCASIQDLYAHVGFGDRRPQTVSTTALHIERARTNAAQAEVLVAKAKQRRRAPSGLSVDGVGDIQGVRAKCCSPLPGDDVVGFVTRGRGMVIHRRACAQLQDTREPERLVDVDWGPDGAELHSVAIEVHASDRPGVLGDLLKLIAQMGVYVSSAQLHADRQGNSVIRLGLEFHSARQVSQALERMARHPDVSLVRRVDA